MFFNFQELSASSRKPHQTYRFIRLDPKCQVFFNKTGFTQLWAKLGFFLPSNTACFKPELQIYLFDKLKFLFFCRFVIVHRIITKLIGLVYLFSKINLILKKYMFHHFCGRLDQIRLQKTDFSNLNCLLPLILKPC